VTGLRHGRARNAIVGRVTILSQGPRQSVCNLVVNDDMPGPAAPSHEDRVRKLFCLNSIFSAAPSQGVKTLSPQVATSHPRADQARVRSAPLVKQHFQPRLSEKKGPFGPSAPLLSAVFHSLVYLAVPVFQSIVGIP
jgi:hypothetical protein